MSYSSPTCFSLISIIAFSSYYWIARPDAIKQYGTVGSDGKSSVAYGILFDKTANTLEALNGTLRAAKRQKKVAFDAELLMMPKDKDVLIVLLDE